MHAIQNKSIDLKLIDIQKYIFNRAENDVMSSIDFTRLMMSIRTTKSIIQPVVVRDTGDGRFVLFAGFRRYLAYKTLVQSGYAEFQLVPALIHPKETTIQDMILKTAHENDFRKDLNNAELIKSKVSMLPLFLDCGKEKDPLHNFILGHKILKLYISFLRNITNVTKYINLLEEITGSNNAISEIEDFFEKILITPKSFFLSSRVLFECSKNIRRLFEKGRITNRHALSIEKLKSEQNKDEIINQLQKEKMTYKEIENFIRESNAQFSPVKKTKKLLQLVEHVSIQIKSREETLTEDEISEIKMYVEKIENVIQK